MSPFAALISTALGLLLVAALLIWNGSPIAAIARAFPRSNRAAWFTLGISTLWTLYHITRLGESDFGEYKRPIFIAFLALAIASVRYVSDFLAVRGACALTLLVGWALLMATYGHYEFTTRIYKAFIYLLVILALYLTVSPFRLRDFVQWLFARPARPRALGMILAAFALLFMGTALAYHT